MCVTCGCSVSEPDHTHSHAHGQDQAHGHDHSHSHGHSHPLVRGTSARVETLRFERSLLAKNQRLADANRAWLAARQSVAFNMMGSPGAGKTAVLEGLARHAPDLSLLVVEGDQATERDAERIRQAGCRAIQINTGTGCHLEAHAVAHGLEALAPEPGSRIVFENVGNLVCPALFDLGESARIVVLSVTEGDDKPLKYPHMFRSCQALILNKIDLLPYVNFDVSRALAYAKEQNPELVPFQVSATRGDGLAELCSWLRSVPPLGARESEPAARGAHP